MTARAFLTNLIVIASVMAFAALLETAVPLFAAHAWTRGRRFYVVPWPPFDAI